MPIKQVAYVSCSELVEDAVFTDNDQFNEKLLINIDEEIGSRIHATENDDNIEEK